MRAVDTNVVLRVLLRDDAEQTRIADEYVRSGAWVSHVVLAEVTWVLQRLFDLPPARLAESLRMLREHENLVLQDPDVVAAALERFKARPEVGFADCLIVEVARKAGHGPLGTFDRTLGRLEGVERL